jgi:hypothetical protein
LALPDQPHAEDLVSLLRSGRAPIEVRRFAAKGILPLDSADQLRALFVVLDDPVPAVAASALETFNEIPPDAIAGFLAGPDVTEAELDTAAHWTDDGEVLVRVVQHRNVSDATLAKLARNVTGTPQEALIVNQARLLRDPSLIDALYENPELTADGRRLLTELKEEFFEKESLRKAARVRRREKLAEPEIPVAAEVPEGDAGAAEEAEEGEEGENEGPAESPSAGPEAGTPREAEDLYIRLMGMSVPEKVKLALTGTREERRFLLADGSKMVGLAVLRARGLTPTEVEGFCGMRHLDSDIFKKIATTRDWIRRPLIALALVKNPKAPLTVTLPLVKRLSMRDLRNTFRDRNLPEAVRAQARKIYMQRRR